MPVDELPVAVLDDEVDGLVLVELSGVVEVESPGASPVSAVELPVEVGVAVGVVEEPPVVLEALLSEGAVGLTPPPLNAVEIPPVARSLTLTGAVVVIEVETDGDAPGLVDDLAESPLAAPAEACGRAISGAGARAVPESLDSALGEAARCGATVRAGATTTGRACWRW